MYKEVINISDIQIVPIPPKNGLVAFCSFLIDDLFFVGNVALYSCPSNPDGFRLVYPAKMGVSCFNPINRDVGMIIQKQVVSQYLELIEKLRKSEKDLDERDNC